MVSFQSSLANCLMYWKPMEKTGVFVFIVRATVRLVADGIFQFSPSKEKNLMSLYRWLIDIPIKRWMGCTLCRSWGTRGGSFGIRSICSQQSTQQASIHQDFELSLTLTLWVRVGCGLWSEADFKSFLRNSDAGGSLSNHLTIQFKFKLEEEKESLNSRFHNLHCGVRSSLVGELTSQ